MLAPIVSIKHYVQTFITSILTATVLNVEIADSVIAPAAAANEVLEGSIVKAVFVEIWATNIDVDTTRAAFNLTVEKRPGNTPAMTNAQSLVLDRYPNKKNILYTTQGILTSGSAGPAIPLFRQWIKIPKGKQRMGLDDKIVLNISNVATSTMQVCGVYTYKEYR